VPEIEVGDEVREFAFAGRTAFVMAYYPDRWEQLAPFADRVTAGLSRGRPLPPPADAFVRDGPLGLLDHQIGTQVALDLIDRTRPILFKTDVLAEESYWTHMRYGLTLMEREEYPGTIVASALIPTAKPGELQSSIESFLDENSTNPGTYSLVYDARKKHLQIDALLHTSKLDDGLRKKLQARFIERRDALRAAAEMGPASPAKYSFFGTEGAFAAYGQSADLLAAQLGIIGFSISERMRPEVISNYARRRMVRMASSMQSTLMLASRSEREFEDHAVALRGTPEGGLVFDSQSTHTARGRDIIAASASAPSLPPISDENLPPAEAFFQAHWAFDADAIAEKTPSHIAPANPEEASWIKSVLRSFERGNDLGFIPTFAHSPTHLYRLGSAGIPQLREYFPIAGRVRLLPDAQQQMRGAVTLLFAPGEGKLDTIRAELQEMTRGAPMPIARTARELDDGRIEVTVALGVEMAKAFQTSSQPLEGPTLEMRGSLAALPRQMTMQLGPFQQIVRDMQHISMNYDAAPLNTRMRMAIGTKAERAAAIPYTFEPATTPDPCLDRMVRAAWLSMSEVDMPSLARHVGVETPNVPEDEATEEGALFAPYDEAAARCTKKQPDLRTDLESARGRLRYMAAGKTLATLTRSDITPKHIEVFEKIYAEGCELGDQASCRAAKTVAETLTAEEPETTVESATPEKKIEKIEPMPPN
jgi:hypothetical protein